MRHQMPARAMWSLAVGIGSSGSLELSSLNGTSGFVLNGERQIKKAAIL